MAKSLSTLVRNAQHAKPSDYKRYISMLDKLPEKMFGRQRRTRMSPEQIARFLDERVIGRQHG